MSKCASLLLVFILLSTLAVAGMQLVTLTTANPFPTNPKISIISPANKTYNVKSLVLDVTIETKYDGFYFTSTRQVTYSIDEKPEVLATETYYSYSPENQASTTKYTATLPDLTDGLHYLTVYAKYDYDVHIITSQTNVHFTIDANSEVTPEIPEFPSWIILPPLLTATVFAILIKKKMLASFT